MTELLVYALPGGVPLTGRSKAAIVWLALASYPLMWFGRHVTDPLVLGLNLDRAQGLGAALYLLVTSINLVGMLSLWAACVVGLLAAARSGAVEAEDRDPVAVVHGVESPLAPEAQGRRGHALGASRRRG